MKDEVESRLAEIVEEREKSLDWAKEKYQEELNDLLDRAGPTTTEEEVREHAIALVRSDLMEVTQVGSGGEEVEVLAIGHAGVQNWSDGDGGKKQVVRSYGVINPSDGPPGISVFINDETSGVDIGGVMNKFQCLNTMKAHYRVSKSDNLSNTYICNSTEKTMLEVESVGGIPDDVVEKRNLLQRLTDEVEIAHIEEGLSLTNSEGYTADFGADIKRITGQVMNRYVNHEKGFGIYKILDKSVIDESELEGTRVMGEEDRVPGLSVWCQPEMMEYGEDSQVEIYGQVRTVTSGANQGQIVMDAYGIVPLIEMPVREDEEIDNSNVEETTI